MKVLFLTFLFSIKAFAVHKIELQGSDIGLKPCSIKVKKLVAQGVTYMAKGMLDKHTTETFSLGLCEKAPLDLNRFGLKSNYLACKGQQKYAGKLVRMYLIFSPSGNEITSFSYHVNSSKGDYHNLCSNLRK